MEGETTLKNNRVSAISFSSQGAVKNQLDRVSIQILNLTIYSNKYFKLLKSCYYLSVKYIFQ